MKRLTSLLAAVLLLLLAISTAFAGQPADYNKPTVAAGTLVYLSNPRRASDDPGSPAARLAAKARYFGLKLRTPLDFAAVYDTDGRLEYDAEQNVTEVQLADFSPELALTLKKLIASIVAFHGTFFGAHTRYHVRPVLFAIDAGTTAPTLHE